jgi:hypothetical protein
MLLTILPSLILAAAPIPAAPATPRLDTALAERFARLALACVHREYPNKIAHVLNADADARPPRELTPAFYGCYDWHSSVHGHWLLARVARLLPEAPFAVEARQALGRSLTAANVAVEVQYLEGPGRVSFERPYGLAWLLQLAAELREGKTPEALAWSTALEPLERLAARRLREWLPKLTEPIRVGEHSQTAFAFGLVLDWARVAGDTETAALVVARTRDYYGGDRDCPLAYEPSGEDFLSPCLAEADLMRRVLPVAEYAPWLDRFLPHLPRDGRGDWLAPGIVTDPTDPKLAHLDGLNLSRAWMLEGMAAVLPQGDARVGALRAAADRHREVGLRAVTGEHYEGGHWLGTFAVYLVTGRGLPVPARDTDADTSPTKKAAEPRPLLDSVGSGGRIRTVGFTRRPPFRRSQRPLWEPPGAALRGGLASLEPETWSPLLESHSTKELRNRIFIGSPRSLHALPPIILSPSSLRSWRCTAVPPEAGV